MHTAVQQTIRQLSGLTVLDLVPSRWLHLTLREIGYVDKLPAAAAANALAEARRSLSRIKALELSVGPRSTTGGARLPSESGTRCPPATRAPVREVAPTRSSRCPTCTGRGAPSCEHRLPPVRRRCRHTRDLRSSTPSVSVKVSHVTLAEVTRRNWRYEWSARGLVSLTS